MNYNAAELRRKAVEELRDAPADSAIPGLINAMKDPDWRVRKTAAMVIEDYPYDLYTESVIGLLRLNDNAGARNTAIEVLTAIGKSAAGYLIKAYESDDADVRKSVVDIAGNLRDRVSLPLLLRALKDEDDNIRASAVEALGYIDDPAVTDILIGVLKSNNLWTSFPAAGALGRTGDRRAVPALTEVLSVKALREPVINALGRISAVESLDKVVSFLNDPSLRIQEEALLALEMFYHNGIPAEIIFRSLRRLFGRGRQEGLLIHLRSKRKEVKTAAILILGLMQYRKSVGLLLSLYAEEDLHEEDISKALVYMGRENPGFLTPFFKGDDILIRRFVINAASNVAAPAYYRHFIRFLSDNDGHVRAIAATGLSRIGENKAVRSVWKLVADEYPDVRDAAASALAVLSSGIKLGSLTKRLKDSNPFIRRCAAFLIGKKGARSAVRTLGFGLKDEDITVRKAVVDALSNMRTKESSKLLSIALTDERPEIRASAANSLGAVGGPAAFGQLCLLLNDPDDRVRTASVRSLGALGDSRAESHLINMLSDANGLVVTGAIECLGRIGGNAARDALIRMLGLEDAEIRRTAIRSLSSFKDIEYSLLPFLKSPDWATRISALEALSRHKTKEVLAEVKRVLLTEDEPLVKKALKDFFNA